MYLNGLNKWLVHNRLFCSATDVNLGIEVKRSKITHMIRIMNISVFLLLFVSLQIAFAGSSAAQRVSLNEKNASVFQLLGKIEKQTGYTFFLLKSDLESTKKIDISVKNVALRDALDKVFYGLDCHYEIQEKIIVLRKAEKIRSLPIENLTVSARIIQNELIGQVSDVDGNPLQGVSVLIKGTPFGTTTDSQGKFKIAVEKDQVLIFNYVGFELQEKSISDYEPVKIVLTQSLTALDEVVVVAFGTQKRATITGSIASVGEKAIKSITNSDLSKGLAGKLPGIRVVQNSSEPGSFDTRFDIRGFSEPLFIVDGMEMSKSDFVRLNPNTIKDISILKDASAAVYGVKSANGVVLVTTQKGQIGKPVISYTTDYEIQKFTKTLVPLDAYNFAVLTTEVEINNGISPNSTTFSREDIQAYKDGTKQSTNWYDLVTRPHSNKMRHNLSVNGGSERIQYFTSVGYMDEDGMWKSGDLNYEKYDFRTSITGKITEHLKMSLSIDGMQDQKNEPGAPAFVPGGIGGMYFSLFMQVPTNPVYANNNPDYLQDSFDGQHPLAISNADIGGYTKNTLKTFYGNYTIDYDVPFIDGLNASVRYGYYNLENYRKKWAPKFKMYSYDEDTDTYLNTATKNDPANLIGDYTSTQRTTLYGQLNYTKSFLKNNLNATVVYEQKRYKNDNLNTYSEFDVNIDQFYAGTGNHQVNANDVYETTNQNIISKVNYDYDSKYLLESGFNFGGSSQFPPGKRWGFFPYASAGWVISQEDFFKQAIPVVTQLKLRGSWGKMGDDGAAAFQFLEGYDYPNGTYVFDEKLSRGLGFRSIPNPNLTWSTSVTKNVGLDVEINNRSLYLNLDFFQRDRSGLLATRTTIIPGTIGQSLSQENLNRDMIRGFEFVVGHSNRKSEFKYDLSANLSFTRGRLTHIERNADANSWEDWRNNGTDRWTNIVWGYEYLGQFQSYEEIVNSPLQGDLNLGNKLLKPGDLKYKDINNDGIINRLDQIPIGRGNTPEISFGINGTFSYKQFDLSVLFQGATNVNYLNDGPWFARAPIHWVGRSGTMRFTDRWHRADLFDVDSEWIPGRYPSTYSRGPQSPSTGTNTENSAFWINNSSYIRLKSAEIGYTIKSAAIEKIGIKNLRLVVSGFNLLTWIVLEDVDPERLRDLIYPNTTTFNFGLNLQL